MKKMKKIFALLIAMVMMLGMSTSVFAAKTETAGSGPASITITLPTDSNADNQYSYTLYKVFDATYSTSGISYSLVDGKTTVPAGFILDDGGNVYLGTTSTMATGADGEIAVKVNGATVYVTPQTTELTSDQISAIASYVNGMTAIGTYAAKVSDATLTISGLDYGYYYITTTTGTVVTVDSTNPNAAVRDKNTVPTLDKTITGATEIDAAGKVAMAQVGSVVTYTVKVTVGKGVENYVVHDVFGTGISLVANSITVKVGSEDVDPANYDLTVATGDTVTVTFDNAYTASLAQDTEIIVSYQATVTSDALTVDAANNTARLEYKNGSGTNSTPTSSTDIYNATITVNKTDGDDEALAGAGFILKRNSDNTYYHYENGVVTWVAEAQATEYTTAVTDGVASIAFKGLANGEYTLIEKTTPSGYNTAADSTFTINDADTTTEANRTQSTTVVNNAGAELPSTGGMGTTIFYIIGAILVVGAGVILVARRRTKKD